MGAVDEQVGADRGVTVQTLTLTGRLWRTRGRTLYLLLFALAPLLTGNALWAAHQRLSGASIGLFVTPRLTVDFADVRWPGLQRGDRILALDGVHHDTAGALLRHERDLPRGPVHLRLQRGEAIWETAAETTPQPRSYAAGLWARVAAGTLLLALALLAFLMRPGTPASWLFLLFAYALGFLQLLPGFFFAGNWLFTLEFAVLPVAVGLGLHLFGEFPRPLPLLVGHRRRLLALHGSGVLLGAASSAGSALALPWLAELAERLTWLWCLGGAIAATLVLALQHRRAARSGDRRASARYRTVTAAVALGLLAPTALASGAQLLPALADELWLWDIASGGVVLFAAMTGYALVRHNPLEIDRFTASIVGYAATIAALGALYGLFVVGLPLVADGSQVTGSPVALVLLTAITTVSISPLYRRLRRHIDGWFLREQVDASRSLELLQDLLHRIQQGDGRRQSQELALAALRQALRTDGASLWVLDPDRGDFGAHGAAPSLPRWAPRALMQVLQQGAAGGVRELCDGELSEPAQQELLQQGHAMAAPIRAHGGLVGFVAVNRKLSGLPYGRDELALLRTVAAQMAFLFDRAGGDHGQLGRYRIERRLGVGGAAEVFLAWQLGPGGFERRVAIKRPLPHLAEDATAISMLLDEARIAAQLQHRHVARIYEVGREGDAYYIAMEHVDGPSLRSLIRAASAAELRLEPPLVAAIAIAVLEALHHAHEQCDAHGRPLRLVHRDVSPSNVLVNRQGEVKLVDFGIARAESRLYRTLTGVVRGTLPYMAPEQARGGPADRRADVYGAACLVHELFTLQRAFPHGPVPHRAVRVDRLVPGLPGAVGDAVARALAYRQEERTATAQAFADELRTALLPIAPASTEEIAGLVHRLLAATDRQAHESLLVAARLPAEEATRPTAPLPAMRSSDPAASPPDP